jgi:heme exporter protein CcmD
MHVTAAYGITAVTFGALAAGAWWRHRAARRRLAELDPRGAGREGTA